jgi:plasmid stabilization system protein ParE
MDRQTPRATSDEIDLYIRTYYSLLRSSGDVRVRAFEEAHLFSRSSLHLGAEDASPDLAAFAYSAARLPDCMPNIRRVVLGQSMTQFQRAGYPIDKWQVVRTRGRRRPLRWDGGQTLAVFVASGSDIDDLVPIVTAYQIEWNKLRDHLLGGRISDVGDDAALAAALGTDEAGIARLRGALGPSSDAILRDMIAHDCDVFVRLLDGSFREYQRSTKVWWQAIAPAVPAGRPVYFVSSNSHAFANLLGGYARAHREEIVDFLRRRNFEDLAPRYDEAIAAGNEPDATAILYYSLRAFLHEPGNESRMGNVQDSDQRAGVRTIMSPGKIDVDAQVIELSKLTAENLDPRVCVPGLERLAESRAVIINIDYPLGMAAYHHLSALALGVDELRGVYIMGKAATLNGRVGDVMISKVVHDEHSSNTYLFRNALVAADVQPYMRHGTVLDNQKALTVRSAFLQNREYMDVFYREGYTVMEMEAGPYLSAAYELVEPRRHPSNEIVSLVDQPTFELGVIHYASDTPYSRRQSLLSKSLSYFGMESTYGCAIAIARRIFASELARLK